MMKKGMEWVARYHIFRQTLQLGKAGDYKWWDGGINGVE